MRAYLPPLLFLPWIGYASGLAGPTSFGAIPGGASKSDSDTGDGRAWGLPGGRDWTFTIGDHSQTTELYYEFQFAQIAFDGFIIAPDEVLTTCTDVILPPSPPTGLLRIFECAGSTRICDTTIGASSTNCGNGGSNGWTTVETYLVLKVYNPDPFSYDDPTVTLLVDGRPRINLKGNDPTLDSEAFKINILFEARTQPSGIRGAALEVFDAFSTPNTDEGKAVTGFSAGFFWEPVSDILVIEHDADIKALLGPMQADLDEIQEELDDIDLDSLRTNIADDMDMSLMDQMGCLWYSDGPNCNTPSLDTQFNQIMENRADDRARNLLGCLWYGQGNCPLGGGTPSLSEELDNLSCGGLQFEMIESKKSKKKEKAFFIHSVPNITISQIFALDDGTGKGSTSSGSAEDGTGEEEEIASELTIWEAAPIFPQGFYDNLQILEFELPKAIKGATVIVIIATVEGRDEPYITMRDIS